MKTLNTITSSILLGLLLFSCNKNENAPTIVDQEFTVQENSQSGTIIGAIEASDEDEGQIVSFEIIDGNSDAIFKISSNTGILSVDDASKLDFEMHTELLLRVSVSDSHKKDPRETSASVKVNITDENEFIPEVEDLILDLYENPVQNQAVGTVEASDQDSHQTLSYSIKTQEVKDFVKIDASTGRLTVLDSSIFDFESRQQLVFDIEVKDDHKNPQSATGKVIINILDVLELTEEMVAHYPFDENANNILSNNFHGIVHGATPESNHSGSPNSAFGFDGTQAYISLGSDFDFPEKSISFWFKANSAPVFDYENNPLTSWTSLFVVNHPGLNYGAQHICISNVEGSNRLWAFKLDRSNIPDPTLLYASIETSQWYHVSVLISPNSISLYLDGEIVERFESSLNETSDAGDPYMIVGRGRINGIRFFDGAVDEVMIHSRLLEDQEIKKLSEMK